MWAVCGILLGPSLTVLKFHSLSQRGIRANATLSNSFERHNICNFTWISLWCIFNNAYQGRIYYNNCNFANLNSETFSLELLLREFVVVLFGRTYNYGIRCELQRMVLKFARRGNAKASFSPTGVEGTSYFVTYTMLG